MKTEDLSGTVFKGTDRTQRNTADSLERSCVCCQASLALIFFCRPGQICLISTLVTGTSLAKKTTKKTKRRCLWIYPSVVVDKLVVVYWGSFTSCSSFDWVTSAIVPQSLLFWVLTFLATEDALICRAVSSSPELDLWYTVWFQDPVATASWLQAWVCGCLVLWILKCLRVWKKKQKKKHVKWCCRPLKAYRKLSAYFWEVMLSPKAYYIREIGSCPSESFLKIIAVQHAVTEALGVSGWGWGLRECRGPR